MGEETLLELTFPESTGQKLLATSKFDAIADMEPEELCKICKLIYEHRIHNSDAVPPAESVSRSIPLAWLWDLK
jgi:hypothetical protein